MLRLMADCEDAGHRTIAARAASITFAYTDMGTNAEVMLWAQRAEGKGVQQ